MATSHYFNNFSPAVINEQRMYEDVIVESIKMNGHDVYYIPREVYDSADDIFGENVNAVFKKSYMVEMYLANVQGYEGDGDFFSKFGLEIRDTSNFIVSRRSFERYIPTNMAPRPREGDLIYVPVLGKLFEIKFVEEELMFFALGKRKPYIYELRCEVFRYSNENLNTGVQDIDDLEHLISYTIRFNLGAGSGNYNLDEIVYQGGTYANATATAEVKHWMPNTKQLEVITVKGAFTDGVQLKGLTSNTIYYITSQDGLDDFVDNDDFDNRRLQTEADEFVVMQNNPFGEP